MNFPITDARVALIGFPSVGKSTLLSKMTKTESVVGAYEFSELPGVHLGSSPSRKELEGARLLDGSRCD